jgi:hypothetical protein
MDPPTPLELAKLAADVGLLNERLLLLIVVIAIAGACLLLAVLMLFSRLNAHEHRLRENTDATVAAAIRKITGRISDLELPPAQPDPPPHITRPPRSRRS